MDVGTVTQKAQEERQIEWRIKDFFSVAKDINEVPYDSPEFVKAKVTWNLKHRNITTLQSRDFAIVNDDTWCFRLWPKWCVKECLDNRCSHSKFIAVFLVNYIFRDYDVKCVFSLKKLNGNVRHSVSGRVLRNEKGSGACILIKFSDLLFEKSELVPGNVLTITCTVMRDIPKSELGEKKTMKLRMLTKLSEDFKDLYGNKESCDTTLKVQNTEFKAHRLVLTTRSAVFAAIFKYDTLEEQTGIITIPDCDEESFEQFLKYLYCGIPGELHLRNAFELYYTSDKYNVQELKEYCVEFLIKSLEVDNVCEVAAFATKYNDSQLLSAAQDFFNKNVFKIILTLDWRDLSAKDPELAITLLEEMSMVKLKEQKKS